MASKDSDGNIGRAMIDLAISYGLLSQRLEKALRPLGLNMTQLSLLFHFSWQPETPRTITQLVKVMGINQPGITKATTTMVDKRWLIRKSDANDARVKHLSLTSKGLDILEQAKAATFPLLADSFACLTESDLESFVSHLHALKTRLDENRACEGG